MNDAELAAMRDENNKMRGKLSAISGLLTAYGVPQIKPVNRRIKLLLEMYERDKREINVLRVQLESKVEIGCVDDD